MSCVCVYVRVCVCERERERVTALNKRFTPPPARVPTFTLATLSATL